MDIIALASSSSMAWMEPFSIALFLLIFNCTRCQVFSNPDVHRSADSGEAKVPLYVDGFFSMTQSHIWDGSGCLMAAELALELINNRTDILPDYELRMIWNDSQCTPTRSPRILFDFIHNEPQEIILLGTPCSEEALIVTPAASHWNLITVIYSALGPQLSDRTKYPNLFRTVPVGSRIFNDPLFWLLRRYNWRRIGYITGSVETLAIVQNDFVRRAPAYNITVLAEVITGEAQNQVENFKKEDIRIVFAYGTEDVLLPVFCEIWCQFWPNNGEDWNPIFKQLMRTARKAFKTGFYGPHILWLIPSYNRAGWWLKADLTRCTPEELSYVVESSLPIGLDVSTISKIDKETVAGITPTEFLRELEDRLELKQYQTYSLNNYMSFTFDAVWSIALSLHNSSKILESRNSSKRLEDFTFTDDDIYSLIFNGLAETNFFGVSGPMSFTNGERLASSDISQLRAQCRPGWHVHDRHCHSLNDNAMRDWSSSVVHCEREGSMLTDLSNRDEVSFLANLQRENRLVSQWHVGLHFINQIVDGRTTRILVDLQNKTSELRLEDKGHDCVYIDLEESTVENGDCTEERPYICKHKADHAFVPLAAYTSTTDDVFWIADIEWPGGEVPLDGPVILPTIIERTESLLPAYLHIIMTSFAALGILLTLTVLSIIITSARSYGYTFPQMDVFVPELIILCSCMLMYSSVVLTKSEVISSLTNRQQLFLCQIHSIVGSVGFSLGVSTLVAKIWLIYKASTHSGVFKKARVWELYPVVTAFLAIDLVVILAVNVLYPLRVIELTILTETEPRNEHHVKEYFNTSCTRGDSVVELLLFVDKMLLVLIGSFLTYEVKQVNAVMNGSKSLIPAVYTIALFSACGLVLMLLLGDSPINAFVFSSAIILCCTTMTLLILFIPMMRNFENNFKIQKGTSISTSPVADPSVTQMLEENNRLKNVYEKLKRQLEKKKSSKGAIPEERI